MEITIGTSPLVSIPIVLALHCQQVASIRGFSDELLVNDSMYPQTGCQLNILIINTNYVHLSCWMHFSFCCIII